MNKLFLSRCAPASLIIAGCIFFGSALAAQDPDNDIVNSELESIIQTTQSPSNQGHTNSTQNTTPNVFIPYTTGVSTTGFINSDGNMTGFADVLVPTFGKSTQFLLTDLQAQYHDNNDYAGSAGIGGRWLTQSAGILGAYVFTDYNHAPDGHGFMFISPGVERLGTRFDFSANFYAPVGSKQVYDGVEWADQAGDTSHEVAQGHEIDDMHDKVFYSVGYGGDAEVGYRIPGNFKYSPELFAGGYYFKPQDSDDITGATFRVEVPLNSYLQLMASEAYQTDGSNTLKAGLSFSFGSRDTGFDSNNKSLTDRMSAPIRRNLSSSSGSTLGTNQPVVKTLQADGAMQTEISNISFFAAGDDSNNGTMGDGTAENPYIGLSDANSQQGLAEGNTKFFLAPGQYEAPTDGINFTSDGGLYGRDNGYLQAASDSNVPTVALNGQAISLSGYDNTIDSVNFTAGANQVGNMIDVTASQATINNVQLTGNGSGSTNADGIEVDGNAQSAASVSIHNALISNVFRGIRVYNDSGQDMNLDVENTQINNTYNAIDINNTLASLIFTGNNLILENNQHDSFYVNSGTSRQADGYGNGTGQISVNINNSQLSNNGSEAIESNNKSDININVQNSNLTGNEQAVYMDQTGGQDKSSTLSISNSSLTSQNGHAILQVNGANGNASATVTQSSMTSEEGSTQPLLMTQGTSQITVVDPTAFNGAVNTSGNSEIIFINDHSDGTSSTLTVPNSSTMTVNCDQGDCSSSQ